MLNQWQLKIKVFNPFCFNLSTLVILIYIISFAVYTAGETQEVDLDVVKEEKEPLEGNKDLRTEAVGMDKPVSENFEIDEFVLVDRESSPLESKYASASVAPAPDVTSDDFQTSFPADMVVTLHLIFCLS